MELLGGADLEIHYFQFEPIIDYLVCQERTFSIGTSGEHTIRLGDYAEAGMSQIHDGGTKRFENLAFLNPLERLEVYASDGNDDIVIEDLDANDEWDAELVVHGLGGDDSIDASEASQDVELNGDDGADNLVGGSGDDRLDGGQGVDSVDGGEGANLVISDFAEAIRTAEGSRIEVAAVFTNPASIDIFWGDGSSASEAEKYVQPDGLVGGWHTYTDDGPFDVTVTVTYTDGSTTTHSFRILVDNVAPTVEAGGNATISEGDAVNFVGSFADPGVLDTHTILWDFGDSATGSGLNPSHVYADNGQYTVTLTVVDNQGDVGYDTLTVTVVNASPTVAAGEDEQVGEFELVSFGGSFTDPGPVDTHTVHWDFGDGATDQTGTLTPTHAYAEPGTYTVTLTVTDDDLGVGSDTLTVTVGAPGAVIIDGVLKVRGTDQCDDVLIGKIWGNQLIVIADFLPGWLHMKKFAAEGVDRIEVLAG